MAEEDLPPARQLPSVYVKNTFLDLDDGPRMPELQRWRSTPAPETAGLEDDSDEEEEEPPEDAGIPDGPPPLPDLYRTKTVDGYEPDDNWRWLGGDPNSLGLPGDVFGGGGGDFPPIPGLGGETPEATAPAEPPAPPETAAPPVVAAVPAPQPMIGVVMLPGAGYFVPGSLPAPQPFMTPSGQMAVPVARFTRWPEPQAPAPATAPAEAPVAPPTPAAPSEPPAAVPETVPEEKSEDGSPGGAAPPRAPVLQRTSSVSSSLDRIRWTVDARKLKSTDREAVSPMFELSFGKAVNFKILIRPKVISSVRGGASFKKAKGKGSVELRCLDEVTASMNPTVTFRISVGSGTEEAKQEPPRGPVRHDFTKKAICGLPAGQEEWDFSKAVDEATQTFVVCLEVLAGQ